MEVLPELIFVEIRLIYLPMEQFLIAEKDTSFLKTFKFRFKLSKIASFSYTFSVWVFFQRQRRLAEQQGQEEDHPYSLLFSIISSRS